MSNEAICKLLGERVKRLRLMRNLTQQQVADMTAASLSSVRRLESQGQSSLRMLVDVACALQALDHLSELFQEPIMTIAQLDRDVAVAQRQRARSPRPIASRVAIGR